MDSLNIIAFAVFAVFAYFYAKKKILPRLALKRAAKAGQALPDQTAAGIPAPAGAVVPGQFSGQFPQPHPPVMCFDMRIVDLRTVGDGDGDTFERRITYEANEMLLKFSSRGMTPTLGAMLLSDGILMLYVTYAAP